MKGTQMRSRKFLLYFFGSLLVAGILAVFLTPLIVAGGLRLWLARAGQQEGLRIDFERIEAPLWRPVVLHHLQISNAADAPFHIAAHLSRAELALNFAAVLSQSRGRFLHSLIAEGITVDLRRNPQPPMAPSRFGWRILEDLLADNFNLTGVDLHVENGATIVDLRNGVLSGNQMEAGVFTASDITIESPWFRKNFSELRGATSWQERRLTVGALTLTRGLDLDALIVDLSHIGESRLDLEMALDAFGGKLRARVSSEDGADQRTWDAAGTASEISLAQMSDALELTDRASGSLHACKFTFRGEITKIREAAATVWAEVTGLTWRDRTADTIMIGASLYNRQVQIQQLYVKQRDNQFTLTGESALPEKSSDWLNPDFRGDISASIYDLGEFARLFGANPLDFAGEIYISGNVSARERKLGGQLLASGNSLVLFRAPFESLNANLNLNESRLEIAQFELVRKEDSFRGQASLDLAGERAYSFTFTSSIAEVADYAGLMPETLQGLQLGGSLELDWSGNGTESSQAGTFHARGHGLHLPALPIIPVEAEFEGTYGSDYVFFRQFNLSTPHAALTAFVTVAKDYFQLQTIRLDLNGQSRLQGNVFVPVSFSKTRTEGNWLASLSEASNFDLDLNLEQVDLAELAPALATRPKVSGQASGNLEFHGTPASFEGKSSIQLQDFVFENEPRISADLEVRTALGIVNARATALPRESDPVSLEASFPLKLEKRDSGYALNTDGPLSATLNFPAILLSKLPLYVSRRMFVDGVLSGRLTVSDSLTHPQLHGTAHLINGRLLGSPTLSTGITFGGESATIDFAQIAEQNVRHAVRGEIDFGNLAGIIVKILPSAPLFALTLPDPDDCIDGIDVSPNGTHSLFDENRAGQRINEIDFRGGLFASDWTISLSDKRLNDPLEAFLEGGASRTFPICPNPQPTGRKLTLGLADRSFLEGSTDSKPRRRRK
jgi:hypothetical protein